MDWSIVYNMQLLKDCKANGGAMNVWRTCSTWFILYVIMGWGQFILLQLSILEPLATYSLKFHGKTFSFSVLYYLY